MGQREGNVCVQVLIGGGAWGQKLDYGRAGITPAEAVPPLKVTCVHETEINHLAR